MNKFLISITAGECFLLGFLLLLNPLHQNSKANKWLGLFILIMGTAFTETYINKTGWVAPNYYPTKLINSLPFLLGPSLYMSILFFVYPTKGLRQSDLYHFLPFLVFLFFDNIIFFNRESLITKGLFVVNDTLFIVRDLLPFQVLAYIFASFSLLNKHKENLRLVSSTIEAINLSWLRYFLFILLAVCAFWINDALFEIPVLLKPLPFVYTISIFFLSYFTIKQKNIFDFKNNELEAIEQVFEDARGYNNSTTKTTIQQTLNQLDESTSIYELKDHNVAPGQANDQAPRIKLAGQYIDTANLAASQTIRRLSGEQFEELSAKLNNLIYKDKIFLENELSLPDLSRKLGTSIHNTSYLINEMTGDNFFNFINKHRVEEAKQLLHSTKMGELNILGIAFASGFNSKTAFNTAFKKWAGVPPSTFAKNHKNQ